METRTIILFLLGLTVSHTLAASLPIHIHFQDPTSSSDVDIPGYVDDVVRIKRSGSGSPDFFGYIKRGITGKISQFASASAGASAHFSKGSSGGGGGGGGGYYYPAPHDTPISYGTKSFDFWSLKKSILNTLLQAVKAINGGIIAVKGQLIKGGGAIISAKGRLISMQGEAIANVGRHIIMNSKLSPNVYISKPEPAEYSGPSGHSGPSAISHPSPSYGPPPTEYGPPPSGAPSASAPTAGFPDHPPSTYGAPTASAYGPPIGPSGSAAPSQAYLPQKVTGPYEGAHAGIVLLKKIPKGAEYANQALASLPLQDERHKVVQPDIDVTKTPLFSPEAPKTTPFQPLPPTAPKHEAHPFFESALKSIQPPRAIYGSPIEAAPSSPSGGGSAPSGHSAQLAPLLPTAPSYLPGPVTSPPGFVDESLLSGHSSHGIEQSEFNVNKPLSAYKNFKPPPQVEIKGVQNLFKNSGGLFLSKIPAPFEINSFGGDLPFSNYGLGALNNIQQSHGNLPFKNDYHGGIDSYAAPGFSNLGLDGTDLSSNLQYKDGISDHKGSSQDYEVVKSITYELPIHKRH